MIKPLVLIKPTEKETKTASGIILQEETNRPTTGEVIAIGPGINNIPITVKPGKYSGHSLKYEGIEYIIIPETDILGIL